MKFLNTLLLHIKMLCQDSTYDIYVKILINREKQEAKLIFKPKNVYMILNEFLNLNGTYDIVPSPGFKDDTSIK